MLKRLSQNAKIFMLITGCIILSLAGFHLLIVKQEQVLRNYFIDTPRERLKESNKSWADSVSKSFIRENRTATLDQLTEYIRRYGRTDRFEQVFVFKDTTGAIQQINTAGRTSVTKEILSSENLYPVTVDNGRIEGYLAVIIQQEENEELKEGLVKYKIISYSLRLVFLLLVTALMLVIFYYDYSAKMKLARDIAEIKASNDGLTGLHTHEHFMKALEIEVEKFRIYHTPIALLMLDIDHFKDFNDKFGHLSGDRVLEEVSKIIKSTTRATDTLARYGGEEFAIIMPYVVRGGELSEQKRLLNFAEEIRDIAERIRRNVEDDTIHFGDTTLKVTISVGIAFYYSKSERVSATELVVRADKSLYQAKETGRNRVCIDYQFASVTAA
jgi:diguanylate cyclase (GGDEF)-like protein